jgi:hypothetical protein
MLAAHIAGTNDSIPKRLSDLVPHRTVARLLHAGGVSRFISDEITEIHG